jgi:serine O-acetyltransferase
MEDRSTGRMTQASLGDVVRRDISANGLERAGSAGLLGLLFRSMTAAIRHTGFRAVLGYRVAHALYSASWGRTARVVARITWWCTKALISPRARIGAGLAMPHPFGVIIGWDTRIGDDCFIGQFVTLGGNLGRRVDESKYPAVGDRVQILAGSVIAGPVNIGDDCLVGANSVVTRSVEAGSMVVGNPALARPHRPDST